MPKNWPSTIHVITRYRDTNTNLRSTFPTIIGRAGHHPWPQPFQNLTATRETELMAKYSANDVELVIDSDAAKISTLVKRFDPDQDYISETALREGRMANLIDTSSGDKVDCFILGSGSTERLAFSRRRTETIMRIEIALTSPEDTILANLRWSEMSGRFAPARSCFRVPTDASKRTADITLRFHRPGVRRLAGNGFE